MRRCCFRVFSSSVLLVYGKLTTLLPNRCRTSTKKRHAEVELTETMMQKMRELRMRALVNGLVNNLDNNAVKVSTSDVCK